MNRNSEHIPLLSASPRVITIRGAGKAFSAGTDLKEMPEPGKEYDIGEVQLWYHQMSRSFSDVVLEMRRIPQSIIAAVRGPANGGGFSLTLAGDVRIAGESAGFDAAFVRIGYSACDMGDSYFMARLFDRNPLPPVGCRSSVMAQNSWNSSKTKTNRRRPHNGTERSLSSSDRKIGGA
ncbi:enoyl-CoA hydratase/isomerase family protein [Thermodesulfobacteriota bacterium]